MKILMLSSATPHAPLSHTPLAIGKHLKQRGHTVTLMAPSYDKYSKWTIDKPAEMYGVPIEYPLQSHTKSQIINLIPYMLHASLLILRKKVDVIYIYKPTPISAVGVLAKWFKGSRLVFHTDDLDAEVMRAQGQPKPLWMLVEAAEYIITRNADALIGASRLLQREFAIRFKHKPFLRLPNGVDPSEFPVAPKAKSDHAVRIIFFGILGRARILTPVLEALPKVIEKVGSDRVYIEVLGDGPCREELESISKKLGVSRNVHFRGWTKYDQLTNYASYSDIGVCMMPDERTTAACSNQKVFQYMALGLANVVSNVGDLPLYAEDGKVAMVVPAEDSAALANTIEKLILNPDKRARLAKEGRARAETIYNWSTLAAQVEQLLQNIKA